jgi:hypothetical protein
VRNENRLPQPLDRGKKEVTGNLTNPYSTFTIRVMRLGRVAHAILRETNGWRSILLDQSGFIAVGSLAVRGVPECRELGPDPGRNWRTKADLRPNSFSFGPAARDRAANAFASSHIVQAERSIRCALRFALYGRPPRVHKFIASKSGAVKLVSASAASAFASSSVSRICFCAPI